MQPLLNKCYSFELITIIIYSVLDYLWKWESPVLNKYGKKKTLLCLEICCSLLFFCRCLHFKKSTSFHIENKKSQYEMNIKVPTPSNMSLISRPNPKCKIYLFTIKRKCSQIITFTPFWSIMVHFSGHKLSP